MAGSWRKVGAAVVRRGRQALPAVVSGGLIAWLVWRVSPQLLLLAFARLDWPWLVLATAVQLLVLFLWDSICVWWLFSQPQRALSFRTVLRIRADTVIWSAINLEFGQAAFAWRLARSFGIPLATTLSYCVLLTLVDAGTLCSIALAGSFVYPTPLTVVLRWVCFGGLAVLGLFATTVKVLPARWRERLTARSWAAWLAWFDWRSAMRLWGLRLTMFLLVILYAGIGLAICRLDVSVRLALGIIPFVFLAESLPGTGGLGERETALVYLYPGGADHRAVLLSFGLIWSTVVIAGRIAISLVSWCLPRGRTEAEAGRSAPSAESSPAAAARA